jgi:hypothetical protein
MCPSEFMDQFVHDLLERYESDVLPSGLLYLELRRKGHGVLIIEETVKRQQMHVRYQLYDADGKPVPEPEVVFHIGPDGHWLPFAIHRISAGWHTFADLDVGNGHLIITDPKNQASLAYFADFWAEALRKQGWLKFATKHHGEPYELPEPDDALAQPPDVQDLWDWVTEYGKCTATDGCWVAIDGTCEHGCPSWLVALGLV